MYNLGLGDYGVLTRLILCHIEDVGLPAPLFENVPLKEFRITART